MTVTVTVIFSVTISIVAAEITLDNDIHNDGPGCAKSLYYQSHYIIVYLQSTSVNTSRCNLRAMAHGKKRNNIYLSSFQNFVGCFLEHPGVSLSCLNLPRLWKA